MSAQAAPRSPGPLKVFWSGIRAWRELGVLGVMLMGLSWGIPWFRSLTQATYALSTGRAFLIFGGMMLAAYLLVRLLNAMRLRPAVRRGVMATLLAASILLGLKTLLFAEESVSVLDLTGRELTSFADAFALIPDEFIITVAVLLVWRRGAQLANEKIGPRLIQGAFGIGIAMFFVFILFNTLVTGEGLGNLPVLFLFAGLMAMGASRVSVIGTLRGGRDSPFDRRWMTGLLFSVAGAVGVAAWLGNEVSGGEGWVGVLPRFLLGAVIGFGFLLLTPLFALLWSALYAIVGLVEMENPLTSAMGDLMGQMQGMAEGLFSLLEPYLGPLGSFLARFGLVTKALILWTIVLLLGLSVLLIVYMQDSRRRKRLREQYERISEHGLWAALRDSLAGGLKKVAGDLGLLFDAERRRRMMAAARIRRIYVQLMALCRDLDAPRPEASTPLEFVPTLRGVFPDHGLEIDLITEAYQQVRYGELPEHPHEVVQIERAWERVQAEGAALRRNGAA